MFLLTDGEVYQTAPIVEHMAASQSRVHVLGIGSASQHRFMAQLARRTGGVSDMVSPLGDLGMAGLKLFTQIQEPVLTKVSVALNGIHMPNFGTVWEGLPLLVTDPKGDGSLPGALLVSGTGVSEFPVKGFVQVAVPDGLTAMLWAGRKLEDLSTQMDMAVGTPKGDMIEKEMTDLSVGYGLASRVMSLVAVIERIGDAAGVQPQQKVVALGIPEGMNNPFEAKEQKTSGGLFLPGGASRGMLRSMSMASPPPGVYGMSEGACTMSFDAPSTGFMNVDSEPSVSSNVHAAAMPAPRERRDYSPVMYDSDASQGLDFMSFERESRRLGSEWAAATASPTHYEEDPNFWTFTGRLTGSLLPDLADLKADGGLPGRTEEERVQNTLLLALIVVKAAQQTPGVYDKHIDRMYAFLMAFKDTMGDKIAMHKALKAILLRVCPLEQPPLVELFTADTRDLFQALRTSL